MTGPIEFHNHKTKKEAGRPKFPCVSLIRGKLHMFLNGRWTKLCET